ncbi:MBL fold metallo-hydrolase [Janibacter sp. Y6]|uniref:MBL fold metallo-hydrolase n=1 Tax=Janibacter sp. Y6 TaxID=2913552 RepID=UPI0034A101D7
MAEQQLPTSPMGVRVERVLTSGTFELDGGSWEVENNVWVIGDDEQCVVVDAGHQAGPIRDAVGDRTLDAIICTHAHNDHVDVVVELAEALGAPIWVHPKERELWEMTYPQRVPDADLSDGQVIVVGDLEMHVIHTPGHSPGACCLYLPALGLLVSGDTLFNGGPGATGRSYSDFGTIVESITERLLTLPDETVVLTGHGDSTTIGAEAAGRDSWGE